MSEADARWTEEMKEQQRVFRAEIECLKAERDQWRAAAQDGIRDREAVMATQAQRIHALEAELARLTPSGQVAEDMEQVREIIGTHATERTLAALSRLAATAQGYEVAVADSAALEEVLSPSVVLGFLSAHPPHAREHLSGLTFGWDALEKIAALYKQSRPGAVLLKEREETIRALGRALAMEVARSDEADGTTGHIRSCPNMGAVGPSCSAKCRSVAELLDKAGAGL